MLCKHLLFQPTYPGTTAHVRLQKSFFTLSIPMSALSIWFCWQTTWETGSIWSGTREWWFVYVVRQHVKQTVLECKYSNYQ